MAIQNVDEMILEQMTGKPLDPLPEKPVEVSRETPSEPKLNGLEPKPALEAQKIEPKVEKAAVETNEYGDKPEEVSADPQNPPPPETDDYGFEVEQPKSYSKAEMDEYANRLIRERLARLERNNPPPQQQPQQQQAQQQGFQYDENSNLDWQQQLEQFTMQVIDKRENMRFQQAQRAQEEQRMAEFESKFQHGMKKFNDYHTVVGGKNITDAMVMGARGISDPASFFYAASNRMPEELAKIASEPDPFAQAAAIGRLDAMLRKQANKASNAPRPISPTKGDSTMPRKQNESRELTLDDMLVQAEAKQRALVASRRR
jgi:hypothetical protein